MMQANFSLNSWPCSSLNHSSSQEASYHNLNIVPLSESFMSITPSITSNYYANFEESTQGFLSTSDFNASTFDFNTSTDEIPLFPDLNENIYTEQYSQHAGSCEDWIDGLPMDENFNFMNSVRDQVLMTNNLAAQSLPRKINYAVRIPYTEYIKVSSEKYEDVARCSKDTVSMLPESNSGDRGCNGLFPSRTVYLPCSGNICNFEGCGKKFVRREHLKRHQRTHCSSEKVVCPFCGRPFSRFDNLIAHIKLHDRGGPYKSNRRTKYFPEAGRLIEKLAQKRQKSAHSIKESSAREKKLKK